MKYLFSLVVLLFTLSCATQNDKNANSIAKIEYKSTACFGFCPIFDMNINANRSATFEAIRFNFTEKPTKDDFSKPNEGTFTGTIKAENYNELLSLIQAAKIETLDSKLGNRNVTDMPSAILKVTYKNGTIKEINDYGKRGTPELAAVYKYFESLRFNQDWKKVN